MVRAASPAPEPEAPSPPRRASLFLRAARQRLSNRSLTILLAILMIAGVVASYVATSSNAYCGDTCHVMGESAASWRAGDHANVDCVRCHEGTPALSAPGAAIDRIRHVVAGAVGVSPKAANISARRCLSCHSGSVSESVEASNGIRMSHKEPLSAGMTCSDCHADTGHARTGTARGTRMSQCIKCHTGEQAPGDCSVCHVGDPGMSPVFSRMYPQTQLSQPTCGTCHDEKTCDACHGLRMPHNREFIDGDHARFSGFERKNLCWRCHVKTDCYGCHGDFDEAHGQGFRAQHQEYPRDAQCGTCHKHHEGPFCDRCH